MNFLYSGATIIKCFCFCHSFLIQGSIGSIWKRYSGSGLHEGRRGGQLWNRGITWLHHHCPVFRISLPCMHADGQSQFPHQVLWVTWCFTLEFPPTLISSQCSSFSDYVTKYEGLPSGKSVTLRRGRKQLVPGSEFPLHQQNSNMCKKVFDSSW